MNLLQQLKHAAKVYLDLAYPSGMPESIACQYRDLLAMKSEREIDDWPVLEHEDGRLIWRLGNEAYPHMKLEITGSGDDTLFSIDAHDTHFKIPSNMPGSEKLTALREANTAMKCRVEQAWHKEGIPTFGYTRLPVAISPKSPAGKLVLAIDDEAKILDLLAIILRSLGAEMLRAQSVEEAKRVLEHNNPDMIFCDIMMPTQSGYDFVVWFKQRDHETPIYYVTGLGKNHVDREGVDDVVQKPFSVKDIQAILNQPSRS